MLSTVSSGRGRLLGFHVKRFNEDTGPGTSSLYGARTRHRHVTSSVLILNSMTFSNVYYLLSVEDDLRRVYRFLIYRVRVRDYSGILLRVCATRGDAANGS